MALYFRVKDKEMRMRFAQMELPRRRLQYFLRNSAISLEFKQRLTMHYSQKVGKLLPFAVRARNRCIVTNRAGSIFRHFRLSRIMLKELASRGALAGVRRASW